MTAPRTLVVFFIILLMAGITGHWGFAIAASVLLCGITAANARRLRGKVQVVTVTSWDQQLGHYVVSQHDPI